MVFLINIKAHSCPKSKFYLDSNDDGFAKVVTPLKNGVQVFCKSLKILDSGFRRNDGKWSFSTFYEFVNDKNYFFTFLKNNQ